MCGGAAFASTFIIWSAGLDGISETDRDDRPNCGARSHPPQPQHRHHDASAATEMKTTGVRYFGSIGRRRSQSCMVVVYTHTRPEKHISEQRRVIRIRDPVHDDSRAKFSFRYWHGNREEEPVMPFAP